MVFILFLDRHIMKKYNCIRDSVVVTYKHDSGKAYNVRLVGKFIQKKKKQKNNQKMIFYSFGCFFLFPFLTYFRL